MLNALLSKMTVSFDPPKIGGVFHFVRHLVTILEIKPEIAIIQQVEFFKQVLKRELWIF